MVKTWGATLIEPRKMTDRQKAAHLTLPLVGAVVRELEETAIMAEAAAKRQRRGSDAARDMGEHAVRARGRVEGAYQVLKVVRSVAG